MAQPVYNQAMPAAVPVAPQATYKAPVYQAPQTYKAPVYTAATRQVPTVQAPVTTGSIAQAPVYRAPAPVPVPVYNAPAPAPVYRAPAPVQVYQPAQVPVVRQQVPVYQPPVQAMRQPNADYAATGSIGKPKAIVDKPVVISSFHSLPKSAPRKRRNVDYTSTAAVRPVASVPVRSGVMQAMPPAPVGNPRAAVAPTYAQPQPVQSANNSFGAKIARFFSLPKAAPRAKNGVDYRSTAAINRQTAIQPQAQAPAAVRQPSGPQVASVAPLSLDRNQVRTSGRWTSAGGTMVQVRPGEDIHALSRRYGVPAKAIADVNGLVDQSFVAPGQRVLIPVYQQQTTYGTGPSIGAQRVAALSNNNSYAVPSVIRTPKANPLRLQRKTPYGQQIVRMQETANASQRHMVMPGDTLTGIARRYNVPISNLAAANNLTTNSPVRMGQRLRIPAAQAAGVDYTSTASIRPQSASFAVNPAQSGVIGSLKRIPVAKPRQLVRQQAPVVRVRSAGPIAALPKAKQRVAALKPRDIPQATKPKVMSDVSPASAQVASNNSQSVSAAAGQPKFRWPVRGRIISNFGRKRDGGRNDGINLAVPAGTSVRVAEGGTVIYSGSKLKGYGNLVLVQHANGWVTAYAHNDKVLVSKGQQVRRGQIIAQAGKTGNVDSPQLHFELRIKGDPVDPVPYLVAS
ncbi:MAG: peptidoglycan DD-metalloendopeptidase family protein [Cohaesibacter sp.]|nr:peptidoglycan DD-metalloendopeptidase family protein [Cohaesibacter sp.]